MVLLEIIAAGIGAYHGLADSQGKTFTGMEEHTLTFGPVIAESLFYAGIGTCYTGAPLLLTGIGLYPQAIGETLLGTSVGAAGGAAVGAGIGTVATLTGYAIGKGMGNLV